jgi:O-antigen ligase
MSLMRRYWRDRERWTTAADVFAVLAALTLPWSTSLVAIFVACWLAAAVWMMDWGAYSRLLKQPICYLPLSLVGLAVIGTLWSDAAWGARLFAINPTVKLLVLPVLFYHFERSKRGMWVFVAFLVSCTLLMLMSWIVAIDPNLSLKAPGEPGGRGIFVKNYIAQSQEFALCAVALAYPIISLLRTNRPWPALVLGAIALGFAVNMAFVIVSRTAMVTIPIMLAMFVLLHLKWRTSLMIFGALVIMAGLAWATSPQLQQKTEAFFTDYQLYKTRNAATSIGLRLEFWKKSLDFFAEAPVVGHGTGSTHGLFERAATGNTNSATREVIGNPHNQTLNVAVQWGIIGVILLYAMWLVHLLLFRGEGLVAWIGLLVVVQNIFTSLFNSHIFDFHEGWMYVLGVGVAGGMTLAAKRHHASAGPVGS